MDGTVSNIEAGQNPLATAPIGSLLRKFAIPSVIAMVVNSIYNIVDQIFIQRSDAGTLGNMATTVAFPLITFTLAVSLLIGNGGTALASIRMGEGEDEEASKILGNAFVLTIAALLLITALAAVFFDPLLKLLGASEASMGYSRDYIKVILIGTVFMGIGSGLSGFVRADGAPRVSMFGLVAGCLINIVLDPIFIYVFDMGVSGAALATIISQMITAVITLVYLFVFGKSVTLKAKYMKPDFRLMFTFCALGISSFITQFANALVQISMNNTLQRYGNMVPEVGGDTAVAAMGIVLKTNMLLIGICVGIGTGAQPILGYNRGANEFGRVKETYFKSVAAASAVAIVGWALVVFFPRVILKIFGDGDMQMIDFACTTMRIFLGTVFCAGFNIVTGNYFQAVGKAVPAFIISMSRQVLALLPLIFILPRIFGLYGVLYAGFIADPIAAFMGFIFIIFDIRELNRGQNAIENH